MKIQASIHLVGALTLMSLMNCQAFTPTRTSSTITTNKPNKLATTFGSTKVVNTKTFFQHPSKLHMGVIEDFMAGTDKETRKKDNQKYLENLNKRVERINDLESTIEDLGDEELIAKTMEFRKRLVEDKEDINGPILEEAFAVVREAAW